MQQEPTRSSTSVLLVDPSTTATVQLVEAAASMAGLAVQVHEPSREPDDGTGPGGERPCAIVVQVDEPGWRARIAAVRGLFELAAIPVIGLARKVGDLVFEEAFSIGIDECCVAEVEALGRVLRALGRLPAADVVRTEHRVLVAEPDRATRALIGRVFRAAGYEVSFAVDAPDTLAQAADAAVKVVVCSAALDEPDGSAPPLFKRAHAAGCRAAWILNTPPKAIPTAWTRVVDLSGLSVTVHDAFSAPANLLFVANELLNRPLRDARKSERLLFGTTVEFRQAGRETEQLGYCYNLSAGGLYVRTLAPPARLDDLWLELVPPRTDRRVHMEARAVWVRPYGPGRGATVPAGFGVEITGVTAADNERYQRGYQTFLTERSALRQSLSP
jgi:Tfp pilus assembly protein PilZ